MPQPDHTDSKIASNLTPVPVLVCVETGVAGVVVESPAAGPGEVVEPRVLVELLTPGVAGTMATEDAADACSNVLFGVSSQLACEINTPRLGVGIVSRKEAMLAGNG